MTLPDGDAESDERSLLIRHVINDSGVAHPPDKAFRQRGVFMVLCFLALMIAYMVRVNMSIAVIPMAEQFGWDSSMQGLIMSSFYWGYLITQMPAGWYATRYGGKWLLAFTIFGCCAFTALVPLVASSRPGLIAVRVLTGVAEAPYYSVMQTLVGRWIPPDEHSTVFCLINAGAYVGTIISMAVAPIIIEHVGWEWVFYSFSASGLVWTILWVIFGANSAEECRWISEGERVYIVGAVPPKIESHERLPWGVILRAMPFWAICVCNFCQAWSFYLFLTWLPTYLKLELNFGLVATGLISQAPYVVDAIGTFLTGVATDRIIARGFDRTSVRKFNTALPMIATAVFLACLCWPLSPAAFITLLLVYHVCYTPSTAGIGVNPLDIAPRHAGILMSILNTIGNVPGVVGTITTGFILQGTGSWTNIWLIACGINLFGAGFYLKWGSAKVIIS